MNVCKVASRIRLLRLVDGLIDLQEKTQIYQPLFYWYTARNGTADRYDTIFQETNSVISQRGCTCLKCTNQLNSTYYSVGALETSAPPIYISTRFISASTMFVSSTNCSTESCSGRFVMMSCA